MSKKTAWGFVLLALASIICLAFFIYTLNISGLITLKSLSVGHSRLITSEGIAHLRNLENLRLL